MNSSTIVSRIYATNSNGLRRLFQYQKAVQKPLQKGIDNDIYSTVDACPNACEMWKVVKVETRINRGTGYDNQRVVNVVVAKENVGTQQEEAGFQLNTNQADWKDDSDDEPEDQNCTVKFGNDQIALILGYRDLVQGNTTIKRVYYVEGLNHNLFSIGQFCDTDLEVAFRKSTCYIRDLKESDLIIGSRGTYLYSITLQDTSTPNPICLMAKATSSQACLWHHHLSHLNFDSINLLSKNDIVIGLPKLKFVKDHICSSYHVSSNPILQCPTTALEQDSLSPSPQSQENVTQAAEISSAVIATDAPNKRQQQHTTPSTSTTVAADKPPLNIQTILETTSQAPTQVPTNTKEAMADSAWIEAIQEELYQFDRLDVWELVDILLCKKSKGYAQKEGIDFEESFALVARLSTLTPLTSLPFHVGDPKLYHWWTGRGSDPMALIDGFRIKGLDECFKDAPLPTTNRGRISHS
ncbi:integrase, catalytic region, zinc finger, CCHC-type containing protein [Tanacetum coccineum]